ncbi:MAG TPA: plastocyanin/azurin family copper-binding protein [Acidimicrobiia bacterium]|nr:plastocyanin/azurin family copper-binding protein [Acidimicrobiia bacterium]
MRKFVAILAAGLILAGCADSGSSDTTTADTSGDTTATTSAPPTTTAETTAPETTAPPTSAAADGAAATINISGSSFGSSPTVAVGDEVEVINNDGIPHTWTSSDGVFDSGTLGQGDTFSFIFEEAGEYPFVCVIHPTMTGTVTVEG